MTSMHRRLMASVTPLLAAALLAAPALAAAAGGADARTKTPIRHFITLMQENHTFDNYFGTYPGADGIPKGVCMKAPSGHPCIRPFAIVHGSTDLGHDLRTFNAEYQDGKMDGFVTAVTAKGQKPNTFAMGHYTQRDIPWYWNMAHDYVLFDKNFTASKAGSLPNHLYWVTASPGDSKLTSLPSPTSNGYGNLKTIFDRLEAKHVSWKFYVSKYANRTKITYRHPASGDLGSQLTWVPLLDYARYLDDPKLRSHIVDLSQYYSDLQHGTLPAVSFVAPSGASEHPPGSIQAGQTFVRTMVNALMESSSWKSSAFVVDYDDWGGFWDHVKPVQIDAYGRGFRAPMLLISPYARHGMVDHTLVDQTSQLKFIEHNWGLKPLTARDAHANDFLSAFDFSAPPREAVFRPAGPPPAAPAPARTSIVYLLYGLAMFGTLALVAVALVRRRRGGGAPPSAPAGGSPAEGAA
jgi:phospholipase C